MGVVDCGVAHGSGDLELSCSRVISLSLSLSLSRYLSLSLLDAEDRSSAAVGHVSSDNIFASHDRSSAAVGHVSSDKS